MKRYAIFIGDQEVRGAGSTKQELDEWVDLFGGEVRHVEMKPGERVALGLVVLESVL